MSSLCLIVTELHIAHIITSTRLIENLSSNHSLHVVPEETVVYTVNYNLPVHMLFNLHMIC